LKSLSTCRGSETGEHAENRSQPVTRADHGDGKRDD